MARPPIRRLLIWCPDRRGIIAAATGFLAERGANILEAEQHTDPDDGSFCMRLEFDAENIRGDLVPDWRKLAEEFRMDWQLTAADRRRIAILVSREGHCLNDLLWRCRHHELPAEVACVISNHLDHAAEAQSFGVPYHHLPVTADTKPRQERQVLDLLAEADVDLVLLARYMQVLSPAVIDAWRGRMINIHHSFLPAFAGAKPYAQAYRRGVKLIGATAHYVTEALDEGPIIAQATTPVTHRDGIGDLIRKGRDLERTTLAAAARAHLEDKVITRDNKTIVFG